MEDAAADLGMFSMFGRTGDPTKRGPHKKSGEFFACRKYRNNGRLPRVNESDEQKKVASFSGD